MEQETANKKYILLENDYKEVDGRKLYRIKCIRSSERLADGLIGGYIESETNLSHEGECWVDYDACVYADAVVTGNALVSGKAQVYDKAHVVDSAIVDCNAKVFGSASVSTFAKVNGSAQISGCAFIGGHTIVTYQAKVSGGARVLENAKVGGNSFISGCAIITANAVIRDNSKVLGLAYIGGDAIIEDSKVDASARIEGSSHVVKSEITGSVGIINCWIIESQISGCVTISNDIKVCGEVIKSMADFIVFKNWWSSGRTFAYFTRSDKFRVGCFYGTGAELIKKAYDDSYERGKHYKEIVDYVESIKPELFLRSAQNE